MRIFNFFEFHKYWILLWIQIKKNNKKTLEFYGSFNSKVHKYIKLWMYGIFSSSIIIKTTKMWKFFIATLKMSYGVRIIFHIVIINWTKIIFERMFKICKIKILNLFQRWVIVKKATGNRLLYFTSGNRLRLRLELKISLIFSFRKTSNKCKIEKALALLLFSGVITEVLQI